MSSSLIDRSETGPVLSQSDESAIDRIVQALSKARRLLFITGAGMSADSGLPTYRGRDGIYRAHQTTPHGLSIEQALSGSMLRSRPEITWHYLLELEKTSRHAVPNRGHRVLAEMDDYFDEVWILTQNVDGLHQRTGRATCLTSMAACKHSSAQSAVTRQPLPIFPSYLFLLAACSVMA